MFTLLGPSLGALALGLIGRGSLRGLGRTIVGWPIVVLAIATQWLLAKNPHPESTWLTNWGHWMWAASLAAVLPVLLLNAHRASGQARHSWVVASVGLSLNCSVIFANGGYMPVDINAIEETHQMQWLSNPARFHRDVLLNPETLMPVLSDILPEPAWLPDRKVVSIGDILVSAGLASWVFWAVRASPANGSSARSAQRGDMMRPESQSLPA